LIVDTQVVGIKGADHLAVLFLEFSTKVCDLGIPIAPDRIGRRAEGSQQFGNACAVASWSSRFVCGPDKPFRGIAWSHLAALNSLNGFFKLPLRVSHRENLQEIDGDVALDFLSVVAKLIDGSPDARDVEFSDFAFFSVRATSFCGLAGKGNRQNRKTFPVRHGVFCKTFRPIVPITPTEAIVPSIVSHQNLLGGAVR